MLDTTQLNSISNDQRANINMDKLQTIANVAVVVLDNVASSKGDIFYRPNNANALESYTKSINEIVVNKLVAKFK